MSKKIQKSVLFRNQFQCRFDNTAVVWKRFDLLRQLLIVSVLLPVLFLSSCSSNERGTIISGNVTLDGTPIPNGQIHFLDQQTKVPVAAAIRNGKYSVSIESGEKSVKVFAEKIVGKIPRDPAQPSGEMIDKTEQYVPKKFNTNSELTVTVANKKEVRDFNLKTFDL
ncbi:MAG: hypothetical protein LBU34_04320 [Planctomycetaceae bacterium]|jgi:hypothetical protein|nr:hypothetical protein [Planctomycetaceae bacterium]